MKKDTKMEDYIRTDCKFFDPLVVTIQDYFGKRNELYKKQHPWDKNYDRQGSGDSPIKNDQMTKVKETNNNENENNDNNNNNDDDIPNTYADNVDSVSPRKDLNTSRQLNEEHVSDKEVTKGEHLVLSDNVGEDGLKKSPVNVVLYNNFSKEETERTSEGVTNTQDNNKQEEEATPAQLNAITLRDYDCLIPKHIPIYDLRSTGRYMKDEIYNNHRLFSVVMKQSIMDPVIIRCTRLIFHISGCFASSALCFTDSYLEKRSESPMKVRHIN
jgi:DNA mismatch repair ATPase MutL